MVMVVMVMVDDDSLLVMVMVVVAVMMRVMRLVTAWSCPPLGLRPGMQCGRRLGCTGYGRLCGQLQCVGEVRLGDRYIRDLFWLALGHQGVAPGKFRVRLSHGAEGLFWNFDRLVVRSTKLPAAGRGWALAWTAVPGVPQWLRTAMTRVTMMVRGGAADGDDDCAYVRGGAGTER